MWVAWTHTLLFCLFLANVQGWQHHCRRLTTKFCNFKWDNLNAHMRVQARLKNVIIIVGLVVCLPFTWVVIFTGPGKHLCFPFLFGHFSNSSWCDHPLCEFDYVDNVDHTYTGHLPPTLCFIIKHSIIDEYLQVFVIAWHWSGLSLLLVLSMAFKMCLTCSRFMAWLLRILSPNSIHVCSVHVNEKIHVKSVEWSSNLNNGISCSIVLVNS